MGTRLFIGSLPFSATEQELMDHFKSAGTVKSARVITDRDTGRSKGYGFVEMSTDAEAADAIAKLNGSTMGQRQIVVNEARPMEKRPGYGQGS